jgi:sugar phosphate isomerase/epimerase
MVTTLDDRPTTAASLLTGHHPLGASTGILPARGDWPALVREAAAVSPFAAELAALNEAELPGLEAHLATAGLLPFRYLSVHAPVKHRTMDEAELVARLAALPPQVATVVVHPDTIEDPAIWRALNGRCAIENMDVRKAFGQSADDLAPLFAALPTAGLVLDVAHAGQVDPSMDLAEELLDRFGSRLRHVHVSSLVDGRHAPLTLEDAERFRPVLRRCVDVPWILEAPLP